MADISITGAEELMAALKSAEKLAPPEEEAMLFAAGDVIVEELRKAMKQSRFRLDRIAEKIEFKKEIKRNKNGDPYITVTIAGKNARGERNAKVAFVLNYGRSPKYGKIEGGYFWTNGAKAATLPAAKAAEEALREILQQKGLI